MESRGAAQQRRMLRMLPRACLAEGREAALSWWLVSRSPPSHTHVLKVAGPTALLPTIRAVPSFEHFITLLPHTFSAPRRRTLGWLAGSAALSVLPSQAQFRVEIAGVGATQVPVAVAPFRDEGKATVALSQVLRSDLDRSGFVRSLAADGVADERAAVDLAAWRGKGADALVAGSVMRLADGRFDVRYKLWDAVRGQELLGQSQVVSAADLRLAAHRIADEIQNRLTGERGVNATRIAYVLRTGKRFALHITDADGEGGQIALNKQLAYVSFQTQKAAVWVQDLAAGTQRMVASFRGSNSAPAWSPDGSKLAVTLSQDGIAQLYTMAASGGTPARLTSSTAIDTEPVYSPDGRQIYFVSDRGGGPQIYRIGSGGGSVERVTFSGSYNISPTLSPDGKLLSYISRQGGAFKVALMELEGGNPRLLTDTQDDESPSFAPNGRLIVYATRSQGADVLMTTTLDGKIKTRLLSSGADMREPAWGPYGR
jgi:TolB protein